MLQRKPPCSLVTKRNEFTEEAAELMRALQHETGLFLTGAVVEQGIALLDAGSDGE